MQISITRPTGLWQTTRVSSGGSHVRKAGEIAPSLHKCQIKIITIYHEKHDKYPELTRSKQPRQGMLSQREHPK